MSNHSLFNSDAQKSAYIRDNALILYFETAETPLVARFDLDSLVQANFEVVKRDEIFTLVLRDFSGSKQDITSFATKADAHQALYAILQALLSYGEHKKGSGKKAGLFGTFVKWVCIGLVAALAVAFVLMWFSTPVSHMATQQAQTSEAPVEQQQSEKADVPATAEQPSATVPEGEPMDMDQFVSPSSTDTQTGIAPTTDETQTNDNE